MYQPNRLATILRGIIAGLWTFIGVEVAAGLLSILVRIVEQYTRWFYLGDEVDNWLGVIFLYYAIFPAAFCALVVCARTIKYRWNE